MIFGSMVLAVGASAGLAAWLGDPVISAALINVAIYGAIVVGWHAAVAVHAPAHARLSDLAETFA